MDRFIKGFFWLAFASFLSASILHVAYFFRSFEPVGNTDDILWWIVSYAIAISVDVTIFLLTITIVTLQRKSKHTGALASVWLFVFLLTVLSWYINYEYAQEFTSTMLSHAPVFTVLGVGNINPLIASMFQVLVIVYTWIADKINLTDVTETLQDKAKRLEEEKAFKLRIREVKKGRFTAMVKGAIDSTSEIATYARGTLKASVASQDKQETALESEGVSQEGEQAKTLENSLQSQIDTPVVTWSEEGKVDMVQFPGKEAVVIYPEQPEEVNTEQIEKIETPVASNGHAIVKNIDLDKFLSRQTKKR